MIPNGSILRQTYPKPKEKGGPRDTGGREIMNGERYHTIFLPGKKSITTSGFSKKSNICDLLKLTACLINIFTFEQNLQADLPIKSKVNYAALCNLFQRVWVDV